MNKLAMFGVLLVISFALCDVTTADDTLRYNRDIRSILAEKCFACHGADSAARKGDLRLDIRDVAIESGAIEAGKPQESSLVERIMSTDAELLMPPPKTKKSLSAEEKKKLVAWIKQGAVYERNWSFIAPRKSQLPTLKNAKWAKNEIDHFVLARLEKIGLTPAAEAKPRALFRRLHLDITGLPPKPSLIHEFVADYTQRRDVALSEWIDRLMKTAAWGEHRARYWLDAARYGDTHGLHFDNYREMWPYRDWVIRSFNSNQRFDQFTIEQLAGDLLPNPTESQLIATGFQRCNITTNEGGTIDEENLALYAADRVQTLGWVFLGLTTNCGQCHDHKFDPFTTKDYYSMAAFFRNTTQLAKDGNVKDGRGPVIVVPVDKDQSRWKAISGEIEQVQKELAARRVKARSSYAKWLAAAKANDAKSQVATAGLQAHLPLNEGKGEVIHDLSAKPQKVKAVGKVQWKAGGKLGAAPVVSRRSVFDLPAVGDFERSQSFSYGAWVKAARGNGSGGILARMDEKANYRGWDLWQNGREFAVHIIDSWPTNGLKVVTTGQAVKPGNWQHVFATYDGSGKPSGIKIYVNGKAVALRTEKNTLNAKASIRTNTAFRIGGRSAAQRFEGGSIQDVRVYARNLSSAEVTALAKSAPIQTILATPEAKRTKAQKEALFQHYLVTHDAAFRTFTDRIGGLQKEQKAIRDRSPVTHVQREKMDSKAMTYVLIRGAYDKKGTQVAAATPAALPAMPKAAPRNRLGLAQWVVSAENPLTARVTVNRFWQELFGRGIVATPEDFGVMGAAPSHPELLDWLAVDFRENGWNVKRLFKQFLMSATYRQGAAATDLKLEKDPHNVLLSRGPRFRMDAEMVRDYALATSGLLSAKMYGPGTRPYQPENIWDIVGLPGGNTRNYVQDKGDGLYRRTVYSFWKRMAPPPNLEAFNAPSREVCTVSRERTNTPLQALVTLNDPQFVEAARRLAEQAWGDGKGTEGQMMSEIVARVLGRQSVPKELAILLADLREFQAFYKANPKQAALLVAVGESKPDPRTPPEQLAPWILICNEVMNLDEALTK